MHFVAKTKAWGRAAFKDDFAAAFGGGVIGPSLSAAFPHAQINKKG